MSTLLQKLGYQYQRNIQSEILFNLNSNNKILDIMLTSSGNKYKHKKIYNVEKNLHGV